MFGASRCYQEQFEHLVAGRTDELIEAHYHQHPVLLSVTAVVHGLEALKKHFRNYVQRLGKLLLTSTDPSFALESYESL